MNKGTYIRTKETRKKLSLSLKGKQHTEKFKQMMRNRKVSKETRQKMRLAQLGKKLSKETKQKISNNAKINPNYGMKGKHHTEKTKKSMNFWKGKFFSEETKTKMKKNSPKYWKGKKFSEEHKKQLKLNHKGTLGKRYSEETKRKISKSNIGKHNMKGRFVSEKTKNKMRGANNPSWMGGISFVPYTLDWTNTLKKSIKERDKYICQLCNDEGNIIHHIDYNKKNCNPENLITLCNSCHSKTNFNRNKWIKYFNMREKLI